MLAQQALHQQSYQLGSYSHIAMTAWLHQEAATQGHGELLDLSFSITVCGLTGRAEATLTIKCCPALGYLLCKCSLEVRQGENRMVNGSMANSGSGTAHNDKAEVVLT